MKILRLASPILVAIFAIGLAAASAASALLISPVGGTLTGTSGTSILTTAGEVLTCAKDNLTGTVSTSTLVGGVTVHFLECTAKNSAGETCPEMSPGAPLNNLILTKTLHGVLGLILPKPASGSDVALVLLPVAGSFVTLLGACIPETATEGQIAGLVAPVNTATTKGTLTFGVTGSKQNITDVDLATGGLLAPKLKAFGVSATEETTETLTFSSATEVM